MSLGAGILLIVVGAILAFAIHLHVGWVDLSTVGWILMAAGLVGVVIGVVLLSHRRTATTTSRSIVDPESGELVSRATSDSSEPLV